MSVIKRGDKKRNKRGMISFGVRLLYMCVNEAAADYREKGAGTRGNGCPMKSVSSQVALKQNPKRQRHDGRARLYSLPLHLYIVSFFGLCLLSFSFVRSLAHKNFHRHPANFTYASVSSSVSIKNIYLLCLKTRAPIRQDYIYKTRCRQWKNKAHSYIYNIYMSPRKAHPTFNAFYYPNFHSSFIVPLNLCG